MCCAANREPVWHVQLVMNVPFTAVHFSAYETAKRLLSTGDDEGLVTQLVAGGAAGGLSAACTNPLDVLKTRLQTDGMLKHRREHSSTAMVRGSGRKPASMCMGCSCLPIPGTAPYASMSAYICTHTGFAAGCVAQTCRRYGHSPAGGLRQPMSAFDGKQYLQVNAFRQIIKQEGSQALWHGVSARVAFHVPSAAVCWGVYESVKSLMQVT